jgi:hypothetical protein
MNDAQLQYFRDIAEAMRPSGAWTHIKPNGHSHTGLTESEARARQQLYGGRINLTDCELQAMEARIAERMAKLRGAE